MTDLQPHELANLLPNMSQSEMDDLISDMRDNGYRPENPIYLFEGKILDGRNRYAASKITEVNPTFVEYTGSDAWKFVVSQNLHRRHLDETQRAGVASRRANMERGNFSKSANLQISPVSVEEAAKEMNVSPRTVATYRAVAAAMPELVEQMDSGEITASKAYREIAQAKTREERKQKSIPDGKYTLIYADPPWRYDFSQSDSREIENQYPTMDIDSICNLPINALADNDCILFLWGTNPKLREALLVIEAWGFEYKTNMVWIKDKIGMGYYARQKHELLLIATKGNPGTPEPKDRPESAIFADRTKHSRKPEEFYNLIENMYPNSKKIELFSRLEREGWQSWGNE